MSLRASLKNLIRRDPAASLRERAADLQARISAPKPPAAEPSPAPVHAEQVAQAGLTGDALAGGGIDHRDGTISYADATGKVSRRPVAHWLSFNALQMHARVQAEMARRRMIEAPDLSAKAHAEWEERIRRELRSDAVHALTFRSDRVFGAAQAIRTGAEPATQALREQSDAELLALAPTWEAAVDFLQQRTDEEIAVCATASEDECPGPAPEGSGPEWRAWFQQKEEWRERTGVAAAEEESSEAGKALYAVEMQIADLPAASMAGLKLKARVAQRSDDIGVDWPGELGTGLARDILALSTAPVVRPCSASAALVDQNDLAAASLEDLQALRDTANLVGDVAYAVCWQARCTVRGSRDDYNAAGKLMQWLGDALTDVETAVREETQRRTPATRMDRERRLQILALPVVQNGDHDETEAFARDLLAHAKAERRGG